MIKTSIENIAENIGFDIGNSDDTTQANLLNGFCKGISNSMNDNEQEKQICYIVDKLNPKSHNVLKKFIAFIELKEKN